MPHHLTTINHPKDLRPPPPPPRDAYHQFLATQKQTLANMESAGVAAAASNAAPPATIDDQHLKMLFRKLGVFYNQDDIVMNDHDYADFHHITGSGLHRAHPFRKVSPGYAGGSSSADKTDKKLRHSVHRMDVQRLGGCPNSITAEDGHTIADKTRYYKLCEPIHKLPQCR